MKLALFITCLTDQFYPRVGVAVVRVLESLGYGVDFPHSQTCCGQPMFNNGLADHAADLARRMIDAFEPFSHVVTPSASCAAMIREHYPHLFPGDPAAAARAQALADKTLEFAEFLAKVARFDPRALGLHLHASVTVHTPCHQRALGQSPTPAILASLPGLDVKPLPNAEQCCGFGGAFAVKYPGISQPMVADKARDFASTGAATLVCNDAGCAMNIEGACRRLGIAPNTKHLAELLAESMGLLP